MKKELLSEISISQLKKIANVLGGSSGAGLALEDYTKRKESGEDVVVLLDRENNRYLVGPPLDQLDDEAAPSM